MDYSELIARLESAGLHTSLQIDRLVCATHGGAWGIGGVSFWLLLKEGRWFIASWAPRVYEIPETADVFELVRDALLTTPAERSHLVDESVQRKHSLRELSPQEVAEFLADSPTPDDS